MFGGQASRTLDVLWDGAVIDSPSFTYLGQAGTAMGWVTVQIHAQGNGRDILSFRSTTPNNFGPALDNVSVLGNVASLAGDFSASSNPNGDWSSQGTQGLH